jgi:CHASE3 domain sensor protein
VQRSENSVATWSQWVSHTLEVESKLSQLQSLIADSEAAERGYLLTQQEDNLRRFDEASAAIPIVQNELLALTSDNASQKSRQNALKHAIRLRLQDLQKSLALFRAGQRDEALQITESDSSRDQAAEVRRLIAAAVAEEESLLHDRHANLTWESVVHTKTSILLIVFAGATVLIALLLLARLQKDRALVRMCAWSKTIELNGQWLSFEEYLDKRFGLNISHGISPDEAAKFGQALEEDRQRTANNGAVRADAQDDERASAA